MRRRDSEEASRLAVEMGCEEPQGVTFNLELKGGLSVLCNGRPFPEAKYKVGTLPEAAGDHIGGSASGLGATWKGPSLSQEEGNKCPRPSVGPELKGHRITLMPLLFLGLFPFSG